MKKTIKIISIIIAAMAIYSLLPLVPLYLKKDPSPYTNSQAIERLKGNKGDYFEFIVLGDTHNGFIYTDSATLKLVRHINREDRFKKVPIDFVAVLGDLTFRGSPWDYRIYNRIRSIIKWPVISAAGNHDDDKGITGLFTRYAGDVELAFADRNSYFIMLDNSQNDLTEKQFTRLETELKKSAGYAHRFVITHKSPLSLYQQAWFRPELSPWSYRFMKLCEENKVDIVFTGHEHMFRAEKLGGVKYIMSGGGGMFIQIPAPDGGFLHYLVVRVYGDYVDYEVRKVFPPLWEYLTYYMWKEIFYYVKAAIF